VTHLRSLLLPNTIVQRSSTSRNPWLSMRATKQKKILTLLTLKITSSSAQASNHAQCMILSSTSGRSRVSTSELPVIQHPATRPNCSSGHMRLQIQQSPLPRDLRRRTGRRRSLKGCRHGKCWCMRMAVFICHSNRLVRSSTTDNSSGNIPSRVHF
jgi:hypothetical protein